MQSRRGTTVSKDFQALTCLRAAAFAAALLTGPCFLSSVSYADATIIDLGTLDGGSTFGFGINDSGEVTGVSIVAGVSHAFLFSGGVIIDIGSLGASATGFAINNLGQITGQSREVGGPPHAFLYSGGVMTDLGTLGGYESDGYAINDLGQVVGGSYTNSSGRHAFLYSNGVMTDLGTLGGPESTAYGINNLSQVTGYSTTADRPSGPIQAFLYSGGVMTDLGTLGGSYSVGYAINNLGQVTGYAGNSADEPRAFLYSGGTMINLGTLGGAQSQSFGFAINDLGQVTGQSYPSAPGELMHAFLWDAGDMIDLNSLLPADSGWVLVNALGINVSGQITGYGLVNGQQRAFLITLPDPHLFCIVSSGDDSCLVTASSPQNIAVNAGDGIDTLRLGGARDFSFDVSTIGSSAIFQNFETFRKIDASTVMLTGTSTTAVDWVVDAGEVRLNGSLAGTLTIGAGAMVSGNGTVAGQVTNNGTINPGNSPGSNFYGAYVAGAGAVFNMEVQFNNAGAPINGITHDFVSITGSASGATTLLNITPFAPSGSPSGTTGNGVELVRVGGATGAGQFALAAPVFQGAHQYVLAYMPNYSASLDGYFLQSQLVEGLFGDAVMFSAGQAMTSACFRGTDELVGDGTRSTQGRGWAKVSSGSRSTGPDTGIDSEQDFTCGSGGLDVRVANSMRVGISGGYGTTDVDVQTMDGVGKLDGDGGMIQGFLGYAHEHMFANLSLGYGNISWNFDGPLTAPVAATTGGVIGSLQAGMLWPMGDWRLGAMAELGYDDMTCGNQCLLAGTVEDINNWSVKGTVRLDGTMSEGKIIPFLAVSLSEGGSNTVTNGTASITTDTASSLLSAKAGITAMVGSNTAVFINAGITEGLSNDVSGADGTAGVKLFW